VNGETVEDTFAEAFRSYYSRVLITGSTSELARTAAVTSTGFATSALGCGVEAGIETELPEKQAPDGRPGIICQYHIWSRDPKKMYGVLLARIGHCVLTAPSTAVFDATANPLAKIDLGVKLGFFGDGYEEEGEIGGRKVIIIPIMGGEFKIEREVGMSKGISGGNLWFMGSSQSAAIEAARSATAAISGVKGVITPFPGGVCSSGSKVGAERYKFLANSTNHPYCPTLRGKIRDSKVPKGVESIMEVVINGTSLKSVQRAMKVGIDAALGTKGLIRISAGNFGGKLGRFKIHLRDLQDAP